ncbi:MAG TPA: malto-oligosyltrehalose synthase [Mycobacteriales bacterium]|jgi:malto-oligosyltrehalose synthase|nr:malto-oligosyltrehalose synthase [Mycobacteriales bacterium]
MSRRLGSTYRLQLNGLGFAGAERMVPFLSRLGVETCYVSPITRATAGSTHGYDVIDPTVLDPALGTPAELESLLASLAERAIGLLIDIVPNHMAASTENPFFADVLRLGEDSPFAAYFDIAWQEQAGRILLPVLGRPLDEAVAAGEIRLVTDELSAPAIGYFDRRFPVAPGSVGAGSTDTVEAVLSRQHYRLADWRLANREINYRRFFDINELIGVRQEDPAVFAATHRLVAELVADPRVTGLRVDHVDGLRDPAGYLGMLRELCNRSADVAPAIVVEKILAADEMLPDWPVDGTTGYEFGAMLVGLFVDPAGAADLGAAAAAATGDERSFEDRATAAKRAAIDTLFPHQLDEVSARFAQAVGGEVDARDLSAALRELTACLAVYRTYRVAGVRASEADLHRVERAVACAGSRLTGPAAAALDRVVGVVSGDLTPTGPADPAVSGWQQLSSPTAAKGVEDTAMYGSGRLLAAADVGADPDRPATSSAQFHAAMATRLRTTPGGLSATSTHDSKRSHDVRCRLAVLSEIASEWEATIAALEARLLPDGAGAGPDIADRRYLYETLVGGWPLDGEVGEAFAARISQHVMKAAREAKRHSSWLDPDLGYETAFQQLVDRVLSGVPPARRLIEEAVASIAPAGAVNALASVLIKVTAPGVPDVYQGDDAWSFTLVDPDNRSPIDLGRHVGLLASQPTTGTESWRSGALKQHVTRTALTARRDRPRLFATGDYVPLEVVGERRDHVIAFARVEADRTMLTIVPRLVHRIAGPAQFPLGIRCWGDTAVVLPAARRPGFTELLTGSAVAAPSNDRLMVAEVLESVPVALLSD